MMACALPSASRLLDVRCGSSGPWALAQQREMETLGGWEEFARQRRHFESVTALSERKAVSRIMSLAEPAIRQ